MNRKKHFYNGKTLAEVCREKGVSYKAVLLRIKRNVPEDKLFVPSYSDIFTQKGKNQKYTILYKEREMSLQEAFKEFSQDYDFYYSYRFVQLVYLHMRHGKTPQEAFDIVVDYNLKKWGKVA